MRKLFATLAAIAVFSISAFAQNVPVNIYSGLQGKNHIQGIAVDQAKGEMYMSFTTSFLKTDLQGNLIGSLVNITGHLGCMSLNPQDGKIYASIEYKHDSIGKGIMNTLGVQNDEVDGFYIAIIDPSKVTEPGQDASTAMTTVEIKEALADFQATGIAGAEHRYGCSGIDGVTFAPKFGKKGGKMYLYVAYGIYGDDSRNDNDYQVILCYDVAGWARYEQILRADNLHRSGPEKPLAKYFAFTGNTSWGLQGLCYDPEQNAMFAAAYTGKKPQFPNWNIFLLDVSKKPVKKELKGLDGEKGLVLSLVKEGPCEAGVYGWTFKYGTTGIAPLGEGYFYISENGKEKKSKLQYSNIHLYHWEGGRAGFRRVE